MKKTVNINLNNSAFHIEEDAYNMLDQYLNGIRQHFRSSDPDGEIVNDIEARISELFAEKQKVGYQVITVEMTSEIIRRIGNMGEISEELEANDKEGEEKDHSDNSSTSTNEPTAGEQRRQRKLYRDISNKWVSGVLAGMSAYIDVQPWMLRLLFVVLLFFPKINVMLLLIYIACTFFVNPARTVNDRLEMEGEMVSPGTIWRKISEEANTLNSKATSTLNRADRDMGLKNNLNEAGNAIRKIGSNWFWWSLGILTFFILAFGIAAIFAPDFVTTFFTGSVDALGSGNVNYFVDSLSDNYGVGILFMMVPLALFIGLLILGMLLAVFIIPIGIILRSNLSSGIKIFLGVIYIALLWMIFY